jgi:large subunit ribosomal protein L15
MMRLHNMRPRPGSTHRVKRLGCGESSGHGKTSGKGHKGQKARSGGSLRLGFEGGQMPLIRRLPKRGFNNAAFHKTFAIINLDELNSFKAGSTVGEEQLRAANLVRGHGAGIKILGGGELKHALTIEVDRISASAREKIEKAGGTITLRAARAPQGARVPEEAAAPEESGSAPKTPRKKPVAAKKTSKKKAPTKAKAPARKKPKKKS